MKPTIGQVVLFHPTVGLTRAAIIAYVHSDALVNLAVFNENGEAGNATSVKLIGPDEPKPEFTSPPAFCPYAEWMPIETGEFKLGEIEPQEDGLTRALGPEVLLALKRIIILVDQHMALELAGQR
jgi:hypothetical protein